LRKKKTRTLLERPTMKKKAQSLRKKRKKNEKNALTMKVFWGSGDRIPRMNGVFPIKEKEQQFFSISKS